MVIHVRWNEKRQVRKGKGLGADMLCDSRCEVAGLQGQRAWSLLYQVPEAPLQATLHQMIGSVQQPLH